MVTLSIFMSVKIKSMKQKVASLANNAKEYIVLGLAYVFVAFVICALLFQVTMLGMDMAGSNVPTQIGNWFSWTFDGRFKETKGNIFYEEKHVYISSVNNLIKVGPLTNNQNLSLGVKNVLEEALQDKGYSLVSNAWDADMTLDVDIIYFDVEKIKTNISVFHKDENTVVIRMRGTVAKEGKVIKQQVVEDGSNEIVASTGIVAVDGKFNSTVSRNAIKKTCVLVVSKLF
jgi:hypothetical protein